MTRTEWVRKWKGCQLCPLHKNAKHHVLYRGKTPAEVLLIGEAPGKTEDKLGKPFIGRSGQILTTSLQRLSIHSYCIANVVCCIPLDEEGSIRPPSLEEASTCSPHLRELYALCQPKLIALLGKEAKKHFDLTLLDPSVQSVELRHPAFICRKGGVNSVEFKRFMYDFELALTKANVTHFNCFNAVGV